MKETHSPRESGRHELDFFRESEAIPDASRTSHQTETRGFRTTFRVGNVSRRPGKTGNARSDASGRAELHGRSLSAGRERRCGRPGRLTVETDGTVSNAVVIGGVEPFAERAREAVLAWRFVPVRRDSTPVAARIRAWIAFHQEQPPTPSAVSPPDTNRAPACSADQRAGDYGGARTLGEYCDLVERIARGISHAVDKVSRLRRRRRMERHRSLSDTVAFPSSAAG